MNIIDEVDHAGCTIRVHYDEDCGNPREDNSTAAKLVLSHRRYNLPNDVELDFDAFDGWDEVVAELRSEYDAVVILPVWGYDHGQLALKAGARVGQFGDRWDSGQAGFAFIDAATLAEEWDGDEEKAEACIRGEVEEYDAWGRGECYGYTIVGPDGEEADASCWGFIGDYEAYMLDEAKAEAEGVAEDHAAEQVERAEWEARDVVTV